MFKYALMTMALLSSYPSHAFDLMELDRLVEQDLAKSKKMHSPSLGKGISLSKAVQAEEKKNEKSKE